jgi:hypothetical protein
MEEAARSLRRLIDHIMMMMGADDHDDDAASRRPRVIAKIDGRAGEAAAMAALNEAQSGPVDEILVLTAAPAAAAGGGGGGGGGGGAGDAEVEGGTYDTVGKVVQEAGAGGLGLRTLVRALYAT